jgi:hypothetical protein
VDCGGRCGFGVIVIVIDPVRWRPLVVGLSRRSRIGW